ncbi:MAG: hypothetical protein IPL51_00315 [Candidatus Competibacteraceae bacterium]|nr:hypothetical protein [Candidatus Competibacteraceae bacterium]
MNRINSNNNKKVIIIAPLGEVERRVRLVKIIRIIKDYYHYNIVYWGWQRVPSEMLGANINGVVEVRALLTGGGFRNPLARFYYFSWMFRVFFALLWYAPHNVYCLGLETALPAWAASRLRSKIKYVFDDADRLVMLWPLPKLLKKLIVTLEKRVSRDSLAHIVPTLERYDYQTAKLHEIFNMPEQDQVKAAKRLAEPKQDSRLHVYANGWLDKSRGLVLIDDAAKLLEQENNHDIVFNVAVGRITGTTINFSGRGNINHLGTLTHVQSLAQYAANDVVVTFYDPTIQINRYALPNKWGDAIAMGTPIVLNEGIKTGKLLVAKGAGFIVPFDDPAALVTLLKDLHRNKHRLTNARTAITNIASNYKSFDEAIKPIMKVFLD